MTRGVSAVRLVLLLATVTATLTGCAALGVGGPPAVSPVAGPTGLGAVVASARLQGQVVATTTPVPVPGRTDPGLTLRALPAGARSPSGGTTIIPSPGCTGAWGPAPQLRPSVTATSAGGSASLAVTFVHPGDPDVLSYRAAAVSTATVIGPTRPLRWVSAAAPAVCGVVTITLPGVRRKGPYVVWLDALIKDPMTDVVRELMIGRSTALYVP